MFALQIGGSRRERRLWQGNAGAPHGRGRKGTALSILGMTGSARSEDGGCTRLGLWRTCLPWVPRLQPAAHARRLDSPSQEQSREPGRGPEPASEGQQETSAGARAQRCRRRWRPAETGSAVRRAHASVLTPTGEPGSHAKVTPAALDVVSISNKRSQSP